MDKIERYIEQVCHGIAGPRALRQHVRQELREHLRDAVAGHRAGGMTEEEAVEHALEEFGGPEEVRSELEAAHGQRLMTLVVDKTLEWKEKTMRSKWLWTTWAHLAAAAAVAIELAFLYAVMLFIVPKYLWLVSMGRLDFEGSGDNRFILWSHSFLEGMKHVMFGPVLPSILLLLVALWVWFERRVTSDNKPFMRLSALGTAAAGLIVLVFLTATALVMPLMLTLMLAPQGMHPEALVTGSKAGLDKSLDSLEQAIARRDWDAIHGDASSAWASMFELTHSGAAAWVLLSPGEKGEVEDLRERLNTAHSRLLDVLMAAPQKGGDLTALNAAMLRFHEAYDPVRKPAPAPEPTPAPEPAP